MIAEAARRQPESRGRDPRGERGSALVIALLIMVIMSLMGLAFALVAQTERMISVNERHQAQALYVAEGVTRLVKEWFDDPNPATGFLVPLPAQVNRSLRHVDHDADGTYQLYSTAPAPWNVIYRSGTNDLFEKPYRGNPRASFEGTQANPDLRISASGSAAEKAFLASIDSTLFPDYPRPNLRALVRQIDIYAPPILVIGGQRVRYGIATVLVTVGMMEHPGAAQERQVGERVVKMVLNEAPYPGPAGPLQSCVNLSATGEFEVHWGRVTAVGSIDLHNNLDNKIDSGVPWNGIGRCISRDMNLDGTMSPLSPGTPTPDDQDGNGQYDFDEWVSGGDNEDPWLHYWAENDIRAGGSPITPGCATADCQPDPFFQAPSTLRISNDHSNLFKNVSISTCPDFDYKLWKNAAIRGGRDTFYYAWDASGPGFRRNGDGPLTDFRTATSGKRGLFFFDTVDAKPPRDDDADGLYDNLTPTIDLSGGGYQTGGFIYLNAESFETSGSGSVATQTTIIAPAEPYIDSNNNGLYDSNEYFLDLNYPGADPLDDYTPVQMVRVDDGFTRQDPAVDAAPDGKYAADINVYGVLYTNGMFDAKGNWEYFGSIVTKQGTQANGLAGTPRIWFDERLIKGQWPPPDLPLPRTIITVWETDM